MSTLENFTYQRPTVVIDEKEYKIKRLALGNAFQFIKLLQKANAVQHFTRLMKDYAEAEKGNFVKLKAEQVAELSEDERKLYEERLAAWEAEAPAREEERRDRLIQTALTLIFSMEGAENEIYELLGSLVGMQKDETKELPLDATVEILDGLFKAPDLKSFFKAVKKFLPKEALAPSPASN